jgi:putative ABC transport system permease protein
MILVKERMKGRMKIRKPENSMMRVKLMREILNAKVRFLAITFVVVIGVTIFIGASMSYRNLKTSYEYTYKKLNFADFRVIAEKVPKYIVDDVSTVRGVTMVTPRVRVDTSFSMADGKRLVGRVTGIPTERPIVDDLLVKEGRFFEKGDKMVCIAESHFAKYYGLHPGDTIYYIKQGTEIPVKVIGVAGSPEYLVLAGEKGDFSPMLSATAMAIVYMPLADAQSIADLPNEYNQVLVKVRDPAHMDSQIAAVEEVMKNTGIKEVTTQAEHQGNQMMQKDLEGFKSFALFFPLLFLGIACFSIYILLSRLVYTQRPFIGVMRAMGYSRRQILVHYISFALIIGMLGAIIGAIGGYAVSSLIAHIYAGTIGIPMVRIKVYWLVIFQGMSLSIIFCAIAGLIPALMSARLDPSKAMRGETLEQAFKMPLAERVFPPLSRMPMFVKVPIRNMFRNKRRTVFTVIGLMFSVMIVLVFLAVLNTAGEALNRGFTKNNRFDMVAVFLGGRDAALISKIKRLPGVEDVEPTVASNVKISWDGDSSETVMMGIEPGTQMRKFYTPDRKEVKLTDRHILLNQWFHLQKGVNVGDTVRIKTPYRDMSFIVSPFIEEPMGNVAYVSRQEARQLMAYGQTSRGSFYVKVAPNQYLQARDALEKMDGLATTIDLRQIKREVESYMSLLYVIVYVMLVFALVMAFTLTFNTITINILEREKEIATIRTIGTESWKISAMTTLENVIFGLLAIIPGCILGVLVGRYAMGLQRSEFMTLSLVVNPSSYLLVAAGIIAILLICQVPSLQYVKRVELATATKERGG